MNIRTKSDPTALRLAPASPGSGIHRVSCLRPVTLEPSYTSVSADDEPTVILTHPAAIRHRARLAAKTAATRQRTVRAYWVLAACLVAWFSARVIAKLVPIVEPGWFAAFAVVATFGFGVVVALGEE